MSSAGILLIVLGVWIVAYANYRKTQDAYMAYKREQAAQ